MIDLSKLAPDEELGRRVSSNGDRKLVERGDTPLKLFVREGTNELSVDRIHDDDCLSEVTTIATKYDEGRGRHFHGWATVAQDVASKNGRSVEPSPQPDNQYHADIVLPSVVTVDKKASEQHASELAAKARWQVSAPA